MKNQILLFTLATSIALFGCSNSEKSFNKAAGDQILSELKYNTKDPQDLLESAVRQNAAPSVIKKVLKKGGSLQGELQNGENLQYLAASPEMIKFLRENSVPLNFVNDKGVPAMFLYKSAALAQTALDLLYEEFKGNFKAIKDKKEVLKKIVSSFDENPLDYADNAEVASLWIDLGADLNKSKTNGSPLVVNLKKGNMQVFNLLLEKGANVNDAEVNILTFALKRAKEECYKEEKISESFAKYKPIFDLIIKYGADVNIDSQHKVDLLSEISTSANVDFAEYFLEKGLSPNAKDKLGYTLWDWDSQKLNLNFKLVSLLLQKGINLAETKDGGEYIAREALKKGEIDLVKEMLYKGVPIKIIISADSNTLKDILNFLYEKNLLDSERIKDICGQEDVLNFLYEKNILNKEIIKTAIHNKRYSNSTQKRDFLEFLYEKNLFDREIIETAINEYGRNEFDRKMVLNFFLRKDFLNSLYEKNLLDREFIKTAIHEIRYFGSDAERDFLEFLYEKNLFDREIIETAINEYGREMVLNFFLRKDDLNPLYENNLFDREIIKTAIDRCSIASVSDFFCRKGIIDRSPFRSEKDLISKIEEGLKRKFKETKE